MTATTVGTMLGLTGPSNQRKKAQDHTKKQLSTREKYDLGPLFFVYNWYTIDGMEANPFTDGLFLTIRGGDGLDNSEYPSRIGVLEGGIEILKYQACSTGAGGWSTDNASCAKVVYLSFGVEAISTHEDRSAPMGNTINWMFGRIYTDDFEIGDSGAWSEVVD